MNLVFCLALEKQKGNYKAIDIKELIKVLGLPNNFYNMEIDSENLIDSFTKLFTEEELRNTIKRSNIVPEEYLDGELKIISNEGHRLPIITKDDFTKFFTIRNSEEAFSSQLKDKILGKYRKIVMHIFQDKALINGLIDSLNSALKTDNKTEIFKLIEMPELGYHNIRPIYLLIIEEMKKQEKIKNNSENQDLNNILKLEKLNDVA